MFSQRRSHYWSQQSRTFFFKGFSAKQQKKQKKAANYSVIEQNALSNKYPKMTGQNDRPDESLTGQAHDQAGHCPLTGRYFEPCNILGQCDMKLFKKNYFSSNSFHLLYPMFPQVKASSLRFRWKLTLKFLKFYLFLQILGLVSVFNIACH